MAFMQIIYFGMFTAALYGNDSSAEASTYSLEHPFMYQADLMSVFQSSVTVCDSVCPSFQKMGNISASAGMQVKFSLYMLCALCYLHPSKRVDFLHLLLSVKIE